MEITSKLEKELLSTKEAAVYLDYVVGPQCLHNWRSSLNPKGPSWVKIGNCIRYRKVDLDKFIEQNIIHPN